MNSYEFYRKYGMRTDNPLPMRRVVILAASLGGDHGELIRDEIMKHGYDTNKWDHGVMKMAEAFINIGY
jgi:hypothetical protein